MTSLSQHFDQALTRLPDETDSLITEIADEIRPVVRRIESRPPASRHHFAKYLAILIAYPAGKVRLIVACALIEAGASRAGVLAAINTSQG